ncbi:MotA/TolQ/ExbB proton channel family protein (plasmid) [Chimaeribacter arupi]|uniref:MotA/TolQ/ExbB proton channel family protein n=2 Tax=Yersiniaceae TaxID=1903411 RepID=A0A2N5EKL5_9GAMM|nr:MULTISPECIES: MotA/TolQ/ExbB proton channel family protein [Yersiniaceae]MBS0968514.1 MotA/TolQ/ExbB proton channel family protein [Nissabacter archeti]PLR47067.1 MotA/TolQ/ExbB proton channel family protein [Chimaeribacter arupi]WKZ94500.1 MotA/TolQ/ExbB proton channel family protein [Chimaeribacter arupi]
MNATLLHDIIFYVMYAALAVSLVIIIERAISFAWTQKQAARLAQILTPDVENAAALPDELTRRNSLPLRVIQPVLAQKNRTTPDAMGDLIDTQYLMSKPHLTRGIWLLETVVTAAPLLGLLGTVMGIIDTFKALSASGISDASQVSAGMGTALYATGLGIAIALICLVGNNYLQSRMERISELLKVLLIRAGSHTAVEQAETPWVKGGAQRYA